MGILSRLPTSMYILRQGEIDKGGMFMGGEGRNESGVNQMPPRTEVRGDITHIRLTPFYDIDLMCGEDRCLERLCQETQ